MHGFHGQRLSQREEHPGIRLTGASLEAQNALSHTDVDHTGKLMLGVSPLLDRARCRASPSSRVCSLPSYRPPAPITPDPADTEMLSKVTCRTQLLDVVDELGNNLALKRTQCQRHVSRC